MALLLTDTLYYRSDHPDGYVFSAGTEAPDPAEGWVTARDDVEPPPPRQFEAASMEEFEGLLATSRLNAEAALAEAEKSKTDLLVAEGQIDALKKAMIASEEA
jgi:hypothetical protein